MSFRSIVITVPLLCLAAGAGALEPSAQVQVTPVLKTRESWIGAPIVYPAGEAEVTIVEVEIAPGGETGWHYHPVPSFGVLLSGELEVEFEDGERRHLASGEAAAEAVDVLHNGRNTGAVPAKLLVFYTGVTDKPLTIKPPAGQ